MLASLLIVALQSDPYLLPIGGDAKATAVLNQIVDVRSGRVVSAETIAAAADGKRWVFLGEQHATAPHQQLHADVIEALAKRGRRVVVGLEMITRPKQEALDRWLDPNVAEDSFLKEVDWKGQWGYDFKFYRPIFTVARTYKVPIVALNVPRDWVRRVGRQGYAGLTADERSQIGGDLTQDNQDHRMVFNALMGGHPPSGPSGENIYAAQVLWDEGMADTAARWLAKNGDSRRTVFVVMAGAGHVMYGQGINYRLKRRGLGEGVTVVMFSDAQGREVSRSMGDFVYLTRSVG